MLTLSATNAKIKHIKKLSRRAYRAETGEFLIEGRRAVTDAIHNGAAVSYVVFSENEEPLFGEDIPQFSTDGKTFRDITDTESPQDMLAVAKMTSVSLSAILDAAPERIVFCDRLQDPGNLGTILRTADAVGNTAVVLSEGTVDRFNAKTVRATMSSIFNVMTADGAVTADALSAMKRAGYRILCGALSASTVGLYEAEFSGKCVIVIGNEGNGASAEAIGAADVLIKIPMNGRAESLNASVSAGILLYEHYRRNGR